MDIWLDGAARCEVRPLETVRYYVSPSDFRWLKPQLRVQAGSEVEVGTPLFASKEDERVVVVSPVKGTVREIVRGERRSVETIVLEAFLLIFLTIASFWMILSIKPVQVKIMCYNVQHCVGMDTVLDYDRTANVIIAQQPQRQCRYSQFQHHGYRVRTCPQHCQQDRRSHRN